MEPLLAAARPLLADPSLSAAPRPRALTTLWVEHVCAHRDHMLVFQQERHVIESGDGWRRVRAARKAFERLPRPDAVVGGAACAHHGQGDADGLRHLALLGMVNHTAQWYRPRGALTPGEIAAGYVE